MNGIILGALAGAGKGLQDYGQEQQKTWDQQSINAQLADLSTNKEKAMLDYKNTLASTNEDADRARIQKYMADHPDASPSDMLAGGEVGLAKVSSDINTKEQLSDIKAQTANTMAQLQETRGRLNDAMSAYRESQANNLDRKQAADQEKQNRELTQIYGKQADTLSTILKGAVETGDPVKVTEAQARLDTFNQRVSAVISTAQDTGLSPAKIDTLFNGIKSGQTTVHQADGQLYADAGNGKVFEIPGAIASQLKLDSTPKNTTTPTAQPAAQTQPTTAPSGIINSRQSPSLLDELGKIGGGSQLRNARPAAAPTPSPTKTYAPGR